MRVEIRTTLQDGRFLTDIHIEDMNSVSLDRLNADEIREMIEPQARFILNHFESVADKQSVSKLSHDLVYGVDDIPPSDREDDKEVEGSDCQI